MLLVAALAGCRSPEPQRRAPPDDGVPQAEVPVETASPTGDTAPPPGELHVEEFAYAPPPVDVLLVIDSSSSMTGRIAELMGTLQPLVNAWDARSMDFHVGVVDIDETAYHGRLIEVAGHRWAEPTLADPALVLQGLVDAVGDPSTHEAGLGAAYHALQLTGPGDPNEGFLRAASEVAVIVLTDEMDQTDPSVVTPEGFVAFMLGLRTDAALVGFHALVATQDYVEMANALGGVPWNVTNTPYGPALDAITQSIEGDNAFTLSHDADPASIAVHVVEPSGAEVDLGSDEVDYSASSREVDLDPYYPATGSTVGITYVALAE